MELTTFYQFFSSNRNQFSIFERQGPMKAIQSAPNPPPMQQPPPRMPPQQQPPNWQPMPVPPLPPGGNFVSIDKHFSFFTQYFIIMYQI